MTYVNLYISLRKTGDEDADSLATIIPQVTAIVAYSKGFACACGPGTVHLYEKTDDKEYFKKTREIKVIYTMFAIIKFRDKCFAVFLIKMFS